MLTDPVPGYLHRPIVYLVTYTRRPFLSLVSYTDQSCLWLLAQTNLVSGTTYTITHTHHHTNTPSYLYRPIVYLVYFTQVNLVSEFLTQTNHVSSFLHRPNLSLVSYTDQSCVWLLAQTNLVSRATYTITHTHNHTNTPSYLHRPILSPVT